MLTPRVRFCAMCCFFAVGCLFLLGAAQAPIPTGEPKPDNSGTAMTPPAWATAFPNR